MGSHWPIVVAAGIIALAAGLGIYQHDRSAAAAMASAPAVAQPAATPAPGSVGAARAAPAEKPLPAAAVTKTAVAPAAPVTTPAAPPAVNQAPVPPDPVAPVAAPKPEPGTGRPFKPAPVAPAAVAPVWPKPAAKADPHAKVLQDLRDVFQAKLGVVPRDVGAAGTYAVAMADVRVEVQPWPGWDIKIYNFNRKAAEQESEGFKLCFEIVQTALNIDMTKAAVKTETGKSYMKTTCSLGEISLIRDPATNNSCTIRPIADQALIHPPRRKNAEQVIPAPPRQQGPPVPPPRPPAKEKDEVF